MFNWLKKVKNLAYEGATRGKRAAGFHAPRTGPNRSNSPDQGTLRDRTLAAHRNMPLVYSGIEKNVTNEVGSGVAIRAKTEDEEFNKIANALWQLRIKKTDPELVLNWHGQLTQAVRARRTQGEVFIRKRYRTLSDNLPVPYQLQILESCFCPIELNENLKNGRKIRQGIELDRKGRRLAYYFYKEHPHDEEFSLNFNDYIRVNAKDVIHHFLPTRPGQLRGTPDGVSGLLKAITFTSYDDAELVRKEQRAPYTGFMKRAVDHAQYDENGNWRYDPVTGEDLHPDSTDEVPNVSVQAGTVLNGYPGDELTLFNGDDAGQGYADYMRWQCVSLALSHNIPYEVLTGDWSNVNDRLVRVIMQQYYREIETVQDQLLVHQICMKDWNWFISSGVYSGKLIATDYHNDHEKYLKADFRPHGWDYIHPEQDVNAKIKAQKHDLTSTDLEVSRKGQDPEEIETANLNKMKRKIKKAQELGITTEQIELLREIENHKTSPAK
ncbi:MAG: phage portal protein [Cognaticolwellia aestuarii]